MKKTSKQASPNGETGTVAASLIHISPRKLTVLLMAPWLVIISLFGIWFFALRPKTREAKELTESQLLLGKPGAWGQLVYKTIRIEVPDEFVFVPPPDQPPVRWFFKGYTKERAIEFLRLSGITSAQLEMLQKAAWISEAAGVTVAPGDELILSLAAEARAKIYQLLVEIPENSHQIDPIWFRPGHVEDRIKESGLTPASIDLLKSLLYPQGSSLLLFSDFEPALRQLPNDQERRNFVKAVSRKKTLLARLRITDDLDLESITNYWSVGGRKKDVRPLLNALRQEGGGFDTQILCLLPNFAREHLYLYSYPNSVGSTRVKQDCFWSAMNFFNDPPDDRYNDMGYVKERLDADYYQILQPSQLGDLVFLATSKDAVCHAAAYIADDIVFTKNGESYTQPWILMRMDDMVDTYAVKCPTSAPIKRLFYRKKNL